jgi:hypothetical protein
LFAAAPAIARPAPPVFASGQQDPGSARGVTWGDFEGLNAPQILDSKAPPYGSGAVPAGSDPQRIVARLADQIPSLVPPDEIVPPPRPGAGAGAPLERASTAAAHGSARKPRKAHAPGNAGAGADTFDPLYAGVDQAAPDIDYERVRGALRKSQTQAQAPAPERARSRARSTPRQQRPRYRSRFWPYLLPAVALVVGYYAWTKPPLGALGPSAHALAPGVAASHARDQGDRAGAAAGDRAGDAAEPGFKPIRAASKGRRANPGRAPAHLRDVVF